MKHIFPLASDASSVGSLLLTVLMAAIPLILAVYFLSAPHIVRFEVSPEGLRIRGDLFYSRMIAASDLVAAQARVVDLQADPEHQLRWRRNGTALPNYKAGWFGLRNGEKALVFMGKPQRVAYIPTRSGYAVVLSVKDPERLISLLPGREQF